MDAADVPLEYRAELEAMEDLSDDELWTAAESSLTPVQQRRMEKLLDKNESSELSKREGQSLAELRVAADKMMLRRSYAFLLLKYRGLRVPTIGDLVR